MKKLKEKQLEKQRKKQSEQQSKKQNIFGKLHRNLDGAGNEPYLIIFFLAFFIIALFVFEYARALIIAQGIRDAAGTAIITAATENWDDTYKSRHEGYSGGWYKGWSAAETAAFTERIDKQDLATLMNSIIGSADVGGYSQKWNSNGKVEFRYRITNLVWSHQDLSPASPTGKNFEAQVTIDIQIPWRLNWEDQTPINMTVQTKAIYVPKF